MTTEEFSDESLWRLRQLVKGRWPDGYVSVSPSTPETIEHYGVATDRGRDERASAEDYWIDVDAPSREEVIQMLAAAVCAKELWALEKAVRRFKAAQDAMGVKSESRKTARVAMEEWNLAIDGLFAALDRLPAPAKQKGEDDG